MVWCPFVARRVNNCPAVFFCILYHFHRKFNYSEIFLYYFVYYYYNFKCLSIKIDNNWGVNTPHWLPVPEIIISPENLNEPYTRVTCNWLNSFLLSTFKCKHQLIRMWTSCFNISDWELIAWNKNSKWQGNDITFSH